MEPKTQPPTAKQRWKSTTSSPTWSSIFGGENAFVGSRIAPDPAHPSRGTSPVLAAVDSDDASSHHVAEPPNADIHYRSCSWPKTAALLFAEYICLAVMSYPEAYSQLGWLNGLAATLFNAVLYQYTSLTLWQFCLRHHEVRDICDVGGLLFGKVGWWFTAVMFVLSNTFVMGLHVLTGSEYINTVTNNLPLSICRSVIFSALVAIICWFCSLPRTFNVLSYGATGSAVFTLISIVVTTAFLALQPRPANFDVGNGAEWGANMTTTSENGTTLFEVANLTAAVGDPIFSAYPPPDWTFTSFMVAFLNIGYTFIGQIALPSFIAEMKDPRDFPKALWTCTVAQTILFSIVGVTVYKYTGRQYMSNPALGALQENFKTIAFSFMIPTIVLLGALFASITGRFVFFRMFQDSKHVYKHTACGWFSWMGILVLAVVASIFDAFFGFIYWGVAWLMMRRADKKSGRVTRCKPKDYAGVSMNCCVILIGLWVYLGAGTLATVRHITERFKEGGVSEVFSCNGNTL